MANVGGLLFGADQPVTADAADGTVYSMGTIFTSDVAGVISKVHWRVPTLSPGALNSDVLPIKTQLWKRSTTTVVGTATFGAITLGEWAHVTTAWAIEREMEYICAIVTDRYVATSHYFDDAKTNGHITAPALAGRFSDLGASSVTPVIPNSQFGGGGYFIDLDFIPDGDVSPITVWNGSTEVPATLTVWNGTIEVPASFDTIA